MDDLKAVWDRDLRGKSVYKRSLRGPRPKCVTFLKYEQSEEMSQKLKRRETGLKVNLIKLIYVSTKVSYKGAPYLDSDLTLQDKNL